MQPQSGETDKKPHGAGRRKNGSLLIGRPFVKGQSANPSGRPKSDVGALARQHTAAAIAALVNCLNDPKHAVAAAVAILDRGYGKPQQTTETNVNVNIDPKMLTDEALARLIGAQPKLVEHEPVGVDVGVEDAVLVETPLVPRR